LFINALTLILILVIAFFPDNVFRIILGLPLLLFFPGYVLISALFPRKNSISDIERIALSFGLSVAVVPLIGLGLNYTAWGIRLYPVLVSLAVFILSMSVISWFRSRRLSPDERISFTVPSINSTWTARSRWDKLLNIVLVVVVLATVSTLVYVIARPKTGERFTEHFLTLIQSSCILTLG
jgi:uncharacterized membrane protein